MSRYTLRCMICGLRGDDLAAMQNHVHLAHEYPLEDHRRVTRREIGGGFVYTMPDGVDWLEALRMTPAEQAVIEQGETIPLEDER